MKRVRAFLVGHEKDSLIELLMDHAKQDGRLMQRLVLMVAKRGAKGLDLATYRRAIDAVVNVGNVVDYGEAADYADGIGATIAAIEDLLNDGHAAEVIELAEHALTAVEDAMGSMIRMATWATSRTAPDAPSHGVHTR